MRYSTRAFILCFLPFAALLALSFGMIQPLVQSAVKDGLRVSLRENHLAVARARERSDLQSGRFLKVVGENAALKAGLQLLLQEPGSALARNTVEDQLRELGEHMGFDFLLASGPYGSPLAAVIRRGGEKPGSGQLVPLDGSLPDPVRNERVPKGLFTIDKRVFQLASVSIDQNEENIGVLSVGEYFDLSDFTTPTVLVRDGNVVLSNIPGVPVPELEAALAGCRAECETKLRNAAYISLPVPNLALGSGYVLRSFQNVEAAASRIAAVLRRIFAIVASLAVCAALLFSLFSSRSIVEPLRVVVAHLRTAAGTGDLPVFREDLSSIREIRDLMGSFNQAAVSVREARERLQSAYVEFVGSLANALDARDRYTAGHSFRVSRLSCATASALGLGEGDIERVRCGALLHDIGKIGISDTVLQKPGKLTDREFALIEEHPAIGRRILEGVNGFAPFLNAVELHHENWDGSGYPWGRVGEETPVEARIIHVSDAYDAMTSDRPYRRGMKHEQAIRILLAGAGTQFDPVIARVFANLPEDLFAEGDPPVAAGTETLVRCI